MKPVDSLFREQDQFAQSVILEEELEHHVFSKEQYKPSSNPGNTGKSPQKEKIGPKIQTQEAIQYFFFLNLILGRKLILD